MPGVKRLLVPLLLLAPAVALGWGFNGHRRLSSMLHEPLPQNHCLRNWYRDRQTTTLQDHSCDPDRWRDPAHPMYSPDEPPRHFIEVDRISPPAAYPRDWAQAMQTFPNYHTANGRVPWRVEELYPQLVTAFAAKDTALILDLTFVLSHYVFDSFSVLHNTRDFNPGGNLHQRWESEMLQVSAQMTEITNAGRGFIGTAGLADPKNNIFDIVLVGETLEPQLTAWHFANPTDNVAFFNASKELTARRWGDALTVMASIVWSAWARAGAPVLLGFPASGCGLSVPTNEIVLRGFPVPGGFTHPDGGNPPLPDSGVTIPDAGPSDAGCLDGCGPDDAGMGGGAGGGSGAAGGAGGAGGGGEEAPPCGCAAAPGLFTLALALALLRRRKT